MGQPRSSVYARFSISSFFPQGLWIALPTAVVTQVSEQNRGYLLKKSVVALCRKGSETPRVRFYQNSR